jgi:fructose transport system ATP-binding protein
VIDPKKYSMSDAVAIMTGAMTPPPLTQQAV